MIKLIFGLTFLLPISLLARPYYGGDLSPSPSEEGRVEVYTASIDEDFFLRCIDNMVKFVANGETSYKCVTFKYPDNSRIFGRSSYVAALDQLSELSENKKICDHKAWLAYQDNNEIALYFEALGCMESMILYYEKKKFYRYDKTMYIKYN
ncbi:MAG: hypothetical protein HOO06_15205 [Bdellovibrionaceae bacterium]|jgi:hypothetical protein|nr:hypothetical protein [Pseudobdellovibrionaceae bacterium]